MITVVRASETVFSPWLIPWQSQLPNESFWGWTGTGPPEPSSVHRDSLIILLTYSRPFTYLLHEATCTSTGTQLRLVKSTWKREHKMPPQITLQLAWSLCCVLCVLHKSTVEACMIHVWNDTVFARFVRWLTNALMAYRIMPSDAWYPVSRPDPRTGALLCRHAVTG